MRKLREIAISDLSGGINVGEPQYGIADNQSPDMLNLWFYEKALVKRSGQQAVITNLKGRVYEISEEYCGFRIIHAGGGFFLWDESGAKNYKGTFRPSEGRYPERAAEGDYYTAADSGTVNGETYASGDRAVYCADHMHTQNEVLNPVWHNAAKEIEPADIERAVADNGGVFVLFGEELFHIDGNEIWKFSADVNFDWEYAAAEQYVPIVLSGCAPDLSISSEGEPYNLLCGRFTVKYNGSAGENVCYYVAERDTDTFHITEVSGSITPFEFGDAGTPGWRVRKKGEAWKNGATAEQDGTITLVSHGFYAGDALEFEPGTGTLPERVLAFDINAAKVFRLPVPEEGLTGEISVTVTGDAEYELTSGADFSFDSQTGEVDFSKGTDPFGAPGTGINNVCITACRNDSAARKRKITGCKAAVAFGGESGGARVFTGANPFYPQCCWRSGAGANIGHGMSYFPDTAEEMLSHTAGAVTAMAKMGAELIIFKESSIFAAGYTYDGEDAHFPIRECNATQGCDIPGSVALIDNRLIFASTSSGVNMLISANGEKTLVKPLSANINALLLEEKGLKDAVCCDFNRHYMLCVSGTAYLWDYGRTPYFDYSDYKKAQKRLSWYRWNGVKALTFCPGNPRYEGHKDGIAVFSSARNDFGKPYGASFLSKAFDAGSPESKTFLYVNPSFTADGNIKASITVSGGNGGSFIERDFEIKYFDWSGFAWDAFNWNAHRYALTFPIRTAIKKAAYVQLRVSANSENSGAGLSGFKLTYY